MISPIDALSLTAAVVQFVDFGSKLLVEGYGTYKSIEGASEQNLHIEYVTTDLKSLCEELRKTANSDPSNTNPNLNALMDLATQSLGLAQELLDLLEALKVKSTGPFRAWEAVRKSIKNTIEAGHIATMQKKLSRIKKELDSRLLLLVR